MVLKWFLLLLLFSFGSNTYGQSNIDNSDIKIFCNKNVVYEKKFMEALQKQDFNKLGTLFTKDAINRFGMYFLFIELNDLAECCKKYPNPEIFSSVGTSSRNVGTFGNQAVESIEIQSHYIFRNAKGNQVNDFFIYYNNILPIGSIKRIITRCSINKEKGRSIKYRNG